MDGLRVSGKLVIRDLDPHLDLDQSAPTQRMHSNWPDSARRQLARHFYGMSPTRIFEEEEKEWLREEQLRRARSKSAKSELDTEDAEDNGSPTGASTSPAVALATTDDSQMSAMHRAQKQAIERRQAIERSLQRSSQVVPHRLEVRIKNTERPHRAVVTQHTVRLRGSEEANCRRTLLLGKLRAERKELSKKY